MSRVVRASITFDFDIDELENTFGEVFSDEAADLYVLETFIEDIQTYIKYNELTDVIRLETVTA